MSDPITPEIFGHLVTLAALELGPDEAEYLRRELNNQLKAIQELEAIPIGPDTPLASHGVLYTPQMTPGLRPDRWIPCEDSEAILSQAPETEENYIVVPDIPHTQLD